MSALRELIAHFGVEFDEKGIKKGEGAVAALIEKLKGLAEVAMAGFAVEKVYEFVHGLTEQAEALAKQAKTMGISIAEMQEWNFAARMQSISGELLANTLARLSAHKFDKKAMAAAGISTAEHGRMKSGAQLLGEIADKLAAMPDASKRNELAMKLLGRSYKTLMPFLLQGSKGIEKRRAEFRAMGGGFTDEFARDAGEFNDNITRMQVHIDLLKIWIGTKLLPTALKLSDWFFETTPKVIAFIKHTSFIQTAAGVLALGGIVKLTRALVALGAIGTVKMAAVVAALAAVEDAITFFRGGVSVTGSILDNMFPPETVEWIRTYLPEAFAQLPIGFKILWTYLKQGWMETGAFIVDMWNGTANAMIDEIKSVITALGSLGGDAGREWAAGVNASLDKEKLASDFASQYRAKYEAEREELKKVSSALFDAKDARDAAQRAKDAETAGAKALADAKLAAAIAPAGQKKAAETQVKAAEDNLKALENQRKYAVQTADIMQQQANALEESQRTGIPVPAPYGPPRAPPGAVTGPAPRVDTFASHKGIPITLSAEKEQAFQQWRATYFAKGLPGDYDENYLRRHWLSESGAAESAKFAESLYNPKRPVASYPPTPGMTRYTPEPQPEPAGPVASFPLPPGMSLYTPEPAAPPLPGLIASYPPPPAPNISVVNYISVPPTTDEKLASEVGKAAGKATTDAAALRQTQAVSVPGGAT